MCDYILKGGDKEEFMAKFENAHSEGFDPDVTSRVSVFANQTTMRRPDGAAASSWRRR